MKVRKREVVVVSKSKKKPRIDGTLVIKLTGAIPAFNYFKDERNIIPLREGSYPFTLETSPADESEVYYLFDYDPPVFVNIQVVSSKSPDFCEVIEIPAGKDMALSK